MASKIFVNLPVKDLDRARDFYEALGYRHNPQFTDENATCIVFNEHIYAMLLVEPFFAGFTSREICDTGGATEAILALSVDDRAAVDALADTALASGGTAAGEPMDHGFMYQRSFYDPDGHHWEVFHMDPAHVEG